MDKVYHHAAPHRNPIAGNAFVLALYILIFDNFMILILDKKALPGLKGI
jgi:hypothetical protein